MKRYQIAEVVPFVHVAQMSCRRQKKAIAWLNEHYMRGINYDGWRRPTFTEACIKVFRKHSAEIIGNLVDIRSLRARLA